jgi:hypothetical protein
VKKEDWQRAVGVLVGGVMMITSLAFLIPVCVALNAISPRRQM